MISVIGWVCTVLSVDDYIRPNGQHMLLKRADRLTIIRIQSKNKEATSPLRRRVLQQVR